MQPVTEGQTLVVPCARGPEGWGQGSTGRAPGLGEGRRGSECPTGIVCPDEDSSGMDAVRPVQRGERGQRHRAVHLRTVQRIHVVSGTFHPR